METYNIIIKYSIDGSYIDYVIQLRSVCTKYSVFLKYVETTILDQVKEKIVYAWNDQVRYLGNLPFLFVCQTETHFLIYSHT